MRASSPSHRRHFFGSGFQYAPLNLSLLLLLLHCFCFCFSEGRVGSLDQLARRPLLPTIPIQSLSPSSLSSSREPHELPLFREAPAFRNGPECIPPPPPCTSSSPPPFLANSNSQEKEEEEDEYDELCDPFAVHIAMTLDSRYLRGSVAAILSVVQHAACPENIVFHFLVSQQRGTGPALSERVRATFPYLRFKVYSFNEDLVQGRISASVRPALEHPLNYARTYIADILPLCVKRVIYLDSDVILVDDVVKLWGISLGSHTIGAPEYCHTNISTYFTDSFWSDSALAHVFDSRERKPCYFNTGVLVMDLARWRQNGYTRIIELWMDLQKERRIYNLGSLPPFLLAFAGDVEPVDHRWNQHGLGGDNIKGRCRSLHPGPVSLLHWSGKGKPWNRLDSRRPCPLDTLWVPFDLFVSPHSSLK